jgi:arylsulfatase A-like enzyme
MTGRHGYTNGLVTNAGSPVPQAEHPTLPGVLGRAGYQTRAVGKMHFHPLRAHYGFDHMELLPDYYRDLARRGIRERPMDHGMGQNEMEPVFATVPESLSQTRWIVDRSIDFVETRDPTRPFFMWTSFPKPHPPFDCDPKYWQLYDGIDLPVPHEGDWDAGPFMDGTFQASRPYRFSPDQMRNVIRAYYACITQIDYNLGYLFARLRELGHLENTWIVFTADHGEMLGDFGLGSKGVYFEGSAHVPMIVRPPAPQWTRGGTDQQGATCDRLSCLADVMPTLLARAGVDSPDGVDGLDVMALHDGSSTRDRLTGRCGSQFGIVDGSLKYHYSALGNAQRLFDLDGDPYEQHDLSTTDHPRLASLQADMVAFVREQLPEAVDGDRLVGTGPAPQQDADPNFVWPGFHSREAPSDVTH